MKTQLRTGKSSHWPTVVWLVVIGGVAVAIAFIWDVWPIVEGYLL